MSVQHFFSLCLGIIFLFTPFIAHAAEPKVTIKDSTYAAKFVSQSMTDPIVLEAGEKKTLTITFKNTGTATWNGAGKAFLSAYTMEPRDRKSAFQGITWISGKQTGKISGTVKPGATGDLVMDLAAPLKEGEYTERFYVAAENRTWVKGGYFFLKIKVVPAKPKPAAPGANVNTGTSTSTSASTSSVSYGANRFMQNIQSVSASGGERVPLILAFQNTGTATWTEYAVLANSPTALASITKLSFADELWQDRATLVRRQKEVPPGGIVREDLFFRTPARQGAYTASFQFQVNGQTVPDAGADISVTVTSDAPDHYVPPHTPPDESMPPPVVDVPRLTEEPRIRVGLWKPESVVQFISYEDDYAVFQGAEQKGILPKTQFGFLRYDNGVYSFQGGGFDFQGPAFIRLQPVTNPHAVFTLHNWQRQLLDWKGPRNFNTYRGAAEFRLTNDGKDIYVINDLLFEDYVLGIGENADRSPIEYLKAQTVAQRTYAYYIKMYSGKHDGRNFDVVAHTGDQLYLGYESEVMLVRFAEAARETRGYMVTYDVDENPATVRDIVITPYFGNTDGRTRAWTEVWGGTRKPWLVAVSTDYDKGLRLYGHGVGMSQRDAAYRADKEGLSWQALVKYYYTGVEVEKIYP
ncbi:MAG: SpoIID/LytB domain-containing protein [Patescibacteria group bacterium]